MKDFKEFLKEGQEQIEEGIIGNWINSIIINGLLSSSIPEKDKLKIVSDSIDSVIEKEGKNSIKGVKSLLKKIKNKKYKDHLISYVKRQHMIDI